MKNEDMRYIYDDDDEKYITENQMNKIKLKCYEELKNATDPRYLIGCIYDLYQSYIISEEQETELYMLVDPREEYNNVSQYYEDIADSNNPLKECIGY